MAKRPTIIDVAKKAGVSKSTVSLVLQKNALVKDSTRERVRKAMEETGYVYNRGAAHMRGGVTGLIGLIINNLRNPYYTEFAVSTQMTFAENGYSTVVANSNDDWTLQESIVQSMLEHGVDGLIIAPSYGGPSRDFENISRAAIPTMQVLRSIEGGQGNFPFFSMEYEEGSYEATKHLVDRGANNIAFVGGIPNTTITNERKSGYDRLMTSIGRTPIHFLGDGNRQFGAKTADILLSKHPDIDAVLAFNDLVALGMMSQLNSKGIKLGSDFRLVGFDDIEEASQTFPKLSTVRCDVGKFGKTIAQTMVSWLTEQKIPQKTSRFPVELIVRETS